MIKLYYSISISLLLLNFFNVEIQAQGFIAADDIPHDISYYRQSKITPPLVKVLYGRPQKKDSVVFGNTIPFNKLWRTGANEATEIKFYKDVQFGNAKVKSGTYVLVTIPGKDKWEVILNSQTDVWGSFQYNPTFNVAKITVPVKKAEDLESFSISFCDRNNHLKMVLGWDTTRVNIPLKFKNASFVAKR